MSYCPKRGDIIWIDFTPQAGHEQRGVRPALVISPFIYNRKTRLALICPITSQIKSHPFEVKLTRSMQTKGVVISDQLKSLDWSVRYSEFIEKVNPSVLNEVLEKFKLLIE